MPVLAAMAAIAAAACPANIAFPQSEACAHVLEVYFPASGGTLADIEAFDAFEEQRDAMVRAYGPDGDCWHLDEGAAAQCDRRCRDLLFEDCVAPFDDPADGTPVAPRACDFPPRCSADVACPHEVACLGLEGGEAGCCETPDGDVKKCGYPASAP